MHVHIRQQPLIVFGLIAVKSCIHVRVLYSHSFIFCQILCRMTLDCILLSFLWRGKSVLLQCLLRDRALLIEVTAGSFVSSANQPWLEGLLKNFLLELSGLANVALESFSLDLLDSLHRDSAPLLWSGVWLARRWQTIDWGLCFLLLIVYTLLEALGTTFEHAFVYAYILWHWVGLLDIDLSLTLYNRSLGRISWS